MHTFVEGERKGGTEGEKEGARKTDLIDRLADRQAGRSSKATLMLFVTN